MLGPILLHISQKTEKLSVKFKLIAKSFLFSSKNSRINLYFQVETVDFEFLNADLCYEAGYTINISICILSIEQFAWQCPTSFRLNVVFGHLFE